MKHIYLIKNHHNDVKIGVSISPEKRIRSLELAGNFDVIDNYIIETKFARRFEKRVLKEFKNYRSRGEWFTGVSFKKVKAYLVRLSQEPIELYDMSHIKEKGVVELMEKVLYDN